jgi:hypothetical protein
LFGLPLAAQRPARAGALSFVRDRLVVQQVTVKDKSGKPIVGLTAKDCRHRSNPRPSPSWSFRSSKKSAPAHSWIAWRHLPTQIAAERPLDLRYADRRLLALYST